MYLPPTSNIRVEAAGHDVSYFLPSRPLGKLRWFGVFLIGFSVLFIWGPANGLFETIGKLASTQQVGFEIISFVTGLFFVVMGCFPAFFGLCAIFGRCRVDWRERRLSTAECLGPIRWRRRMPREPIRKFKVDFGREAETNKPVIDGPYARFGVLLAEFERSKPRIVVLGYPRDWLQELAQDLSTRVGASASTAVAPTVEVVDESAHQPELADVTAKPADSQVRIEPRANGLMLVIPPAGLRKGSKGLFAFGIFWCLFMALFTGLMLFAKGDRSNGPPWFIWIFVGGFWLIGVSLLAGSINMGRRRAMLLVEHGELRVAQDGIFGTKRWTWRREEIAAVRADASGMAVNDVPIIELQVHPVTGKKAGFFAGRDEQELRWIATELRRGLNVPAKNN